MAIFRLFKWLSSWFWNIIVKKPAKQNVITRDEILEYVENNSQLRNTVRKAKNREQERFQAEQNANRKKIAKKKAQKKARKKHRK
jgi:hypothetical protein